MTELTAVRDADGAWVFDAVTAAAEIPVKPPADWFADPGLDQPTALTVTADGRIYGHACSWQVRHIGLPGHRTAPKSKTGYREYLRSQVETADGGMIATGPITLGGGHAGLDGDITAAIAHYDDVSAAVADVQVGEDAHGLWMAGALRPGVTPEQIRQLRGSAVSGDWRAIHNGELALCAIHAVNVPGFNVPRASVAASGAPTALVAAGMVIPTARPDGDSDMPDTTPDLSALSTPEEIMAMTETPDRDESDESLTAAPPPFTDDAPADDEGGSGGQFDSGDTVVLRDADLVGQVVQESEDGVTIELVVSPDMLDSADESTAVAASARFTERQADRARDAKLDKLTAAVEGLVAAGNQQRDTITAQSAQIDQLLAEARASEAKSLYAAAGYVLNEA